MNPQTWLADLAGELRRQGVGAELAGQVVAEAEAHLWASGEEAVRVFGPARRYAYAVAETVRVTDPGSPRPGTGPVRLDVRGVTKRYGRRTVLDGVALTVRAGQVAAVVGANGSGKSTFLRICAGLVSPDRGEVRIRGS